MRKYTFELVVYEGNDEFWEGFDPDTGEYRGYATCEEVEEMIKSYLQWITDFTLTLRKYENDEKPEEYLY